jgi:hypothetical protein
MRQMRQTKKAVMLNTILLSIIVIGLAAVYFKNRAIKDGKDLWWATVSEPLYYVSDDPFDSTVSERAANARQLLEAHGNGYLSRENDVWEYVYGATPECPTRDFSQWQDWVLLVIIKRREAWRQQKAGWNADAAKQQFGGQTIYTQTSAN